MANHLRPEKKKTIVACLVEGLSIRATERLTGVHRDTILRHLIQVGERCQEVLDQYVRHVESDSIQVDEIWTFVFKKQKRLTDKDRVFAPEKGDQYVFVAMDADSKLVINHVIGKRDRWTTHEFTQDLSSRLNGNRPQITSDGFDAYAEAIESAFGDNVDYAQILKDYVAQHPGRGRYSPPRVSSVKKKTIRGNPHKGNISTSYVERQNLTMRMQMRRFTRLTNAFSKKLRNLKAAVALHFAYYNFCRVHQSLRVTPAMAAGLTDHIWELDELLWGEVPVRRAA